MATDPDEHNTPLDDDDAQGLIPSHVTTRAELNQWEAVNIARAQARYSGRSRINVLDPEFLRTLHRRMFDDTWEWAGTFRRSDNNISPHAWHNVPTLLHDLVENVRAQYEASRKTDADVDAIATRFHHELVRIHPWPNGNGRHARLATDLLCAQWGRPAFTWGGGANLADGENARVAYIDALRCADRGDFESLVLFVRS
ncbi:MAG: mobile mystery protein B [Gemmatimonadaceae bacterium]